MNKEKSHAYKQSIAAAYSAAAHTYDKAAFAEQQIAARLLERLQYFQLQPKRILDLGCGTGYTTQQLCKIFPSAHITAIDLSFGMVNFAMQHHAMSAIQYCCADAECLPFASATFDLIISNCSIMCMQELGSLSQEMQRVLNGAGLLIFSSFGAATLTELALPMPWPDMHTIGDALLHAQLRDPVVESESFTVEYEKLADLLLDLQETGTYQIDSTVTFPELQLPYSAQYEVIYAHAWGKATVSKQYKDEAGNVYIPIDTIKVSN